MQLTIRSGSGGRVAVILAIALLLGLPGDVEGGWVVQNSGITTGIGAVAAGTANSPTDAVCGSYDAILYTRNSGTTWSRASGMPSGASITDMCGLGGMYGWYYAISVGPPGRVFRSTDYGQNWFAASPLPSGANNGLAVQASVVGLLAGCYGNIYLSPDDGATWSTIYSGTEFITAVYGEGVMPYDWIWATTSSGIVMRSTDYGATWNSVQVSSQQLNDIVRMGSNLYAVGDGGKIYFSNSNGEVWVERQSGYSGQLNAITKAAGSNTLWCSGGGDPAVVLASTGGVNWESQVIPPSYYLWDISAHYQGQSVWAVGGGGMILYSPNGGGSYIEESPALEPQAAALVGIAPQPFISRAEVSFSLAKESRVDLLFCDSEGRLRRAFKKVLPMGRHSVSWDGKDESGNALPAGTYFCRFEAGSQAAVRKMVKTE